MKLNNFLIIMLVCTLFSCKKYLDIIPDNVATLEHAFRMREQAEKYLYTCYSFLPNDGNRYGNTGMVGADEFWLADIYISAFYPFQIARGEQSVADPVMSPWHGSDLAQNYWIALRECNTFLENVQKVPDMPSYERDQWEAEVKFLKAYYHFYLLKHFGPIPIVKENLPINAPSEDVRVYRQHVDTVFNYIVALMDEAAVNLPEKVLNENAELGRITKPIALGIKAKILAYAASPLFNGNPDYQDYTNKDGKKLFDSEYKVEKWQRAADALKEAIDLAHNIGYKIFDFERSNYSKDISEETRIQLNNRGTLTERWNSEIIWANTNSTTAGLQQWTAPRGLNNAQRAYSGSNGSMGATLNIASLFYTENGVPINEDTEWPYESRYNLRTATTEDKYRIKPGYVTAAFNFDRESRFYGSLGFDGGVWYGNGIYDDNNPYWLEAKSGQFLGKAQAGWHPMPGYFVKKYINYTNTATSSSVYSTVNWPWVILRLSDLYLLYAEALNEINGPNSETFLYLDLIREKAGLAGVVESWANYSARPEKPSTKEGLREIIHRERAIEMAFEGERFWDLRRWKEAPATLNQSIIGWDMDQELAENYYREKLLYKQTFSLKDYFWPLRQTDLLVNKNLVQSPGW